MSEVVTVWVEVESVVVCVTFIGINCSNVVCIVVTYVVESMSNSVCVDCDWVASKVLVLGIA